MYSCSKHIVCGYEVKSLAKVVKSVLGDQRIFAVKMLN